MPLVSSRDHNVLISSHAQQKPWCTLLGNLHVRILMVPKTQYQQVYEGNKAYLMDRQNHPKNRRTNTKYIKLCSF